MRLLSTCYRDVCRVSALCSLQDLLFRVHHFCMLARLCAEQVLDASTLHVDSPKKTQSASLHLIARTKTCVPYHLRCATPFSAS